MKSRIMFMEPKGTTEHTDSAPARIGRVTFSQSGKTIHYRNKIFSRHSAPCGNHIEEESGEIYWISGCKKSGDDRLFPGIVEIDEDVREEYWTQIRNLPESKHRKSFRCTGKHGGKKDSR